MKRRGPYGLEEWMQDVGPISGFFQVTLKEGS